MSDNKKKLNQFFILRFDVNNWNFETDWSFDENYINDWIYQFEVIRQILIDRKNNPNISFEDLAKDRLGKNLKNFI